MYGFNRRVLMQSDMRIHKPTDTPTHKASEWVCYWALSHIPSGQKSERAHEQVDNHSLMSGRKNIKCE